MDVIGASPKVIPQPSGESHPRSRLKGGGRIPLWRFPWRLPLPHCWLPLLVRFERGQGSWKYHSVDGRGHLPSAPEAFFLLFFLWNAFWAACCRSSPYMNAGRGYGQIPSSKCNLADIVPVHHLFKIPMGEASSPAVLATEKNHRSLYQTGLRIPCTRNCDWIINTIYLPGRHTCTKSRLI